MGKWRIVRELAQGGTSTVYEAVHRNGRRAAVKVLRPALAADQRGRARFLRESALANRVNHAGVISVLDEDVTSDGLVFLVMELLVGETLEQRWTRCGKRLPVADAIAIVVEILEPLAAVHRVGIVHRDLKPSNVFLSTDGVKVLDFGVARLREINADEGAITRSGAMLGTPAFMAPEQARGHWHDVDARTDIWAVGAILFVLLSGRHVHAGQTPNELLIASATQPAESLARFAPDAPAALVALVDRALSRDKDLRWPDATSMLAELRAIQAIVPGIPQPLIAAAGNDGTPSIATLPEAGSLQLATRARASGSRGRHARALFVAMVGITVVIAATAWKSRSATPSLAAPAHPTSAAVHTLQAPRSLDVIDSSSSTEAESDLESSAQAPRPAPAPQPFARARRVRVQKAALSRVRAAEPAGARDAAVGGQANPQPAATQTFSGIVVDDDALDQRR
jgi:serine/threonine-protein kinase